MGTDLSTQAPENIVQFHTDSQSEEWHTRLPARARGRIKINGAGGQCLLGSLEQRRDTNKVCISARGVDSSKQHNFTTMIYKPKYGRMALI